MSLKGSLESFFLSSILQLLHTENKTGALQLKNGSDEAQVILQDGNIIYAMSSNKEARLGNLLRNKGLITLEQLETCLIEGKQKKQALGKIVVEKGYITIDQLQRFIRKQVEEIIYNLFLWDAGEFIYKDAKLELSGLIVTQLDITMIILEASRRIDEMTVLKKQIPSIQLVFRLTGKKPGVDDFKPNGGEFTLLDLIDGRRTVNDLVEQSGLGKFMVYKHLFTLITSGLIEKCETGSPVQPDAPHEAEPLPVLDLSFPSDDTAKQESTKADLVKSEPVPTEPPEMPSADYSPIIVDYNNIMQIIWKSLEPEIGKETAALFDECKPQAAPGEIGLFTNYHPLYSVPETLRTLTQNLKSMPQVKNEYVFLIQNFNRFILMVLNRVPDILGIKHTQKMLESIQQILPRLHQEVNNTDSNIEFSIVEDVKKIMDRVSTEIGEREKKPSGLLSMFKKD